VNAGLGRSGGVLAAAVVAGLVSAASLVPAACRAQSYFGQNQPQYDKLDWRRIQTAHFEVYFYPSERQAAYDAARMAERSYARLSLVMNHTFRKKKPIILFASRTDFGQNNVTGDLGEGTGGVTEALRHRMLLNFTGDYRSFEHVLAHEMVHAFQYDIFAKGEAGNGLQALAQYLPPLWFAEGMAEYLSLGPTSTLTDTWMRDAALNGRIPTIEQMTNEPNKYFPYRFGHSFWSYVGGRWGDTVIAKIMKSVPNVGVERAFRRELGMSLDEIGDEWREDIIGRLPLAGSKEYPRKFAQPLLSSKRSGGEIFLAPALSPDGKLIAFLSNGSFARGQVFIDLWLGDAESGKRIHRLAPSTTNSNFEELRLLYSQSAFSPDGKQVAFTAQRGGKDVLYIVDAKSREPRRLDLPIESAISPSWSPDGTRLVFSGNTGGLTDLYVVTIADSKLERLTNDVFGDLQPQWSPDGKAIAFATDRGDDAGLPILRFPKIRIALYDVETRAISIVPGQNGFNVNPQWAPDGRSIAYVSDRNGTANVFLFERDSAQHFQLTNAIGAISSITEYSPAISWARTADKLAFTNYQDGDYTTWSITNPRSLKQSAYRDPSPIVPAPPAPRVAAARADSAVSTGTSGQTAVTDSVTPAVSIAALLDSIDFALPDTSTFTEEPSGVKLTPDYVARPSIGYAPDNYGRNVFGGTTIVLSDMLGNHHLAFSGEINGRLNESRIFLGYTNLATRRQFSGGLSQNPYYFLSADSLAQTEDPKISREHQEITIYIARQLFGVTAYPFNRFTRLEIGGGFNNIDRRRWFVNRLIENNVGATPFTLDSIRPDATLNYLDGQVALVSDNTLFGYTGPLLGRRYRFQVSPVAGSFNWIEYLADYRRYDPIIFNYLTVATRVYANLSVGDDEAAFPKYIARPDFVRGYDRNNSFYLTCPIVGANPSNCNAVQLLGSRVAVANVELRFPLIRRVELGILPIALPPLDGLLFFDAGMAWSKDHTPYLTRPAFADPAKARYPLRSYGFGLRLNVFNYAILRWDYAKPLDHPDTRGFWTWSLWPSF
jgi:WD40 repeat protein